MPARMPKKPSCETVLCASNNFASVARMARTPLAETRHGVPVIHPRYLLLPKVGMTLAPFTMAAACLGPIRRLIAEGFDFDLIDAHYYYPDGVAAALIARQLGKPLTITARGTDLNLIPRYAIPRRLMQWAAGQAQASIGVCAALVDVLRGWQVESSRLHVMRNGVDLERFRPLPREQCRQELGVDGAPLLLSVGLLIERKGHHLIIEALARLRQQWPQARLVIVGEGEERPRLETLIRALGLNEAVTLAGAVPNDQMARWYSAADMLVLASSREGWANVLLESMACGTPVVASRIWGTPEVVAQPVAGTLFDPRTAAALATAVSAQWQSMPERPAVRAYAQGFSWEATSRAQRELFSVLAAGRGACAI